MVKTTRISLIFGALLGGTILGRAGLNVEPAYLSAAIALAAIISLIAILGRSRWVSVSLFLLATNLGLLCAAHWSADRAQLTGLIGHKVTVTGIIADDPAVNPNTGQVDFKLTSLHLVAAPAILGPLPRPLPGSLSIHEYPVRVQRGYQVQLTGKVKPGFGNAAAELSFPKFQLLSTQQSWLERFRQRFFAGVRTALPEPIASFGLGLLVGIRALIPKDMQAELSLVGLSHLVAVSGYNLTIIVAAVDRALKRAGRSIALITSLWLIAGFLIITGASASIVRASLVSVFSLLAAYYGRRFHPLALILITGSLTAAYNPGYLTDLGWLLSFLAFAGILILAPAIEARLHNPKPILIRLAIESLAAQLLTLPLILYFFGELSIVAPLSNLVILPLVPLAMAVSFVAGLAGMILPAFAGWLAWPAQIVLSFITRTIDGFAALPWVGRTEHLSLVGMISMYVIITLITVALTYANHRHRRSIIVPDPLSPHPTLH